MSSEDNEIVSKYFPYKSFPKIHGEPTYKIINDYEDKLQKNATSVKTLLTPNNLGFLPVVIGPTRYAVLGHGNFTIPANPGPPPILVAGTTAVMVKTF